MTTIRIIGGPDDEWLKVTFPFDREVIDTLKDASRGLREYDPSTKTWSIRDTVAEQVIDALTAAGHQVLHGEESFASKPEPAEPYDELDGFFAPTTGADKAYVAAMAAVIIEIFDKVPPMSRHKVFRAVSKHLYPEMYARK